jgi:peptide/nickel transport system permease protein
MLNYIFRRLFYGLIVMILVVVTIASIIFLSPVDPTRLTFGQRSDVATVKAKTAELGLDKPLYVQLGMYLSDISPISTLEDSPDNRLKYQYLKIFSLPSKQYLVLKKPYLRVSFQNGRRVTEILADSIPSTLILACSAMLIATFLGIFFGVVSALRPNGFWDQLISVVSVFGYSLPSYAAAIFLALIFGYFLSDWTGLNVQGSLYVLDDFGDWHLQMRNLILPAIALGLRPIALITQLTRSAMLDALSQDYARTARAKGLSENVVIFRHTLRNALNPIASAVSGWFASLLTGAFFVETVFNFKGLGNVTVNALLNFDIPVVLGSVLLTSFVFVSVNLLTDVIYALIDPRIKLF